jgi:chromosome segregation ATPase
MTDNTHASAHNTGAEGVPEHPHITVTPGFLHQLLSLVVGAKPADDVAHMRHVYEQTLQRLSSDIAAKDAALARRHEQAKEMHAKIAEAEKETAALRAQVACLKGSLSASRDLARDERKVADLLRQEGDQLRARVVAAEAKLAEAEPELARWRNSFDGLVFVKNEKYAELVADRNRLAAEVATLHARIAEFESRECAHAAYAAQEAQMKQDDDRDRLAAEVESLNSEKVQLMQDYAAKVDDYSNALREIEKIKLCYEAEIEKWQEAAADKGRDAEHEREQCESFKKQAHSMMAERNSANAERDRLAAEVERLRTQLQATEKLRQMDNEGLAHWCAEAERLDAEVAALKARKVPAKAIKPHGLDVDIPRAPWVLVEDIRAAGVEVEQ